MSLRAGDQIVTLVEIDQPLCQLEYGFTPCQALLGVTGADRCHNTRFTCQDVPAYSPGVLTLRFALAQESLLQYGPLFPLLAQAPDTTPAALNLAAMDKSASGFGQRETVKLVMNDVTHSDLFVDKYRLQRSYDPYKKGTFWGKWIARNPYHSGYAVRIYDGILGEPIDYMRVRHYILDRIDGPNNGQVTITCKDLFSLVEARKAVAPVQSRGELNADISAAAGSLTLNPSGIGDVEYPTSGHVSIGDECIAFTRSLGSDVLTLTERGALNTDAADHNTQDLVQLVVSFVTKPPYEIARDLLVNYVGLVDGVDFDYADWVAKATLITDLYTGRVTEPTPVSDLISELEQQAGFTLWPDVTDGKIKFSALRAAAPIETVTDRGWIRDGTLDLSRLDSARVTEVWVHYGQIRPNVELENRKNYYSTLIEADEEAESPTQYDGIVIREVFSRWIPQFGRDAAQRTGQRLLAMFRDAPLTADFTLYADKAGRLTFENYFNLQVQEVQDEFGDPAPVAMAPTMIENGEDFVKVTSQAVRFPAEAPPGESEVSIFIENDSLNLNMRTIYDSLFPEPSDGQTVHFFVEPGVTVGSTSTGSPALVSGSWPAGVDLVLTVRSGGRIQGKGGAAGAGGEAHGSFVSGGSSTAGGDGAGGGNALQVTVPITIENLGEIWAGGGGGGGGGGSWDGSFGPIISYGGGGGGGGTGTNVGPGAAGGVGDSGDGAPGADSSDNAGGGGGAPAGSGGSNAGVGGDGGGPGLSGSAGGTGNMSHNSPGGSGGPPGNYIVGNSFVTWSANGDRRGGVA